MSDTINNPKHAALILRSGPVPVRPAFGCVAETMRPLPIQPLADMPALVRGVSIIRGEPVPVVDLAGLLGQTESAIGRFVVVRVEERKVALAIGEVIGVKGPGGHGPRRRASLAAGGAAAAGGEPRLGR